jgi:hypothetical protein
MRGIYMIFEFTLKVKLTGVAVIVLELSSYVKFTVEKKNHIISSSFFFFWLFLLRLTDVHGLS